MLCRGRSATRVRKRVQRLSYCSPSSLSSKLPPSVTSKVRSDSGAGNGRCYGGGNGASMVDVVGGKKDGGGRRVMVVADGRAEAVGALEWALSQTVRSNDAVVLLAVVKPAPADGE